MTTFDTTWALIDGALSPDLTDEPDPPEGFYRSDCTAPVPAGHTPEPGDPVTVTLTYAEIPPPLPEPELESEPTPEP